ncbi:EAL domain-containing protein [Pseudomonas putida]|uniref:EAL domain-containing protein n=1 Tax=Pseudomonas putida TaxID=303 RepID=A0A2Z4RTU8_PSEPU|nr:EAL domain-containing protein [Pseudomonas putida]AWY44105.1 EAL domain-containing protein [Pseudomonas putida]
MSYNILVIGGEGITDRFLHALQNNMQDAVFRAARNGREALELFDSHSIDMVLSGLTLSGTEGEQFLQKLVASRKKPALAIIDQTGRRRWVKASLTARNLGFAVVGMVSKPADVIDLRNLHLRCDDWDAAAQTEPVAYDPEVLLGALRKVQVKVRFEPRKNLRSGRITAARAVALMAHPQSGWLASTQVLSVDTGDEFVEAFVLDMLDQVISAQRAWRASGYNVPVWIKLPVSLLERIDFTDWLHALVVGRKGQAECIGLELVRTSKREALIHYLEPIYQLRTKGFAVTHDDFGQGYRGCLNLKLTPFTDVLIFTALVRSAVNNAKLEASLACIVSESQQLGLTVIGEGVATPQELALLKRLNCDEVQGPLIAQAQSPDGVTCLLMCEGVSNIEPVR